MRAATYHVYGDPDVLAIEDVPEPHAGPGQIRVDVRATSVNPIDWKFRSGLLKEFVPLELPAIPGYDAAGVVDEVGAGVTDVAIGDAVFGLGEHTNAERAVLTSWAVKPDGWTFEQAAGSGVAAETATRALDLLGVAAGTTLLIEGAAGGVGSSAAQLAVARGATVIGTASTQHHDFLRSLGATPTTYGPGLADRVRAIAPKGIDVVFDTAGSGSLADLIAIAGNAADVVSIADNSAESLGARTSSSPTDPAGALAQAAVLGAAGRYTPIIDTVFPLERIADAHARSQTRHAEGKIVLSL